MILIYLFDKILLLVLFFLPFIQAAQWPYDRYDGVELDNGRHQPNLDKPEFGQDDPSNLFVKWLAGVVKKDTTGELKKIFVNGAIPRELPLDRLVDVIDVPQGPVDIPSPPIFVPPRVNDPAAASASVLSNVNYPLDPKCIAQRATWWYRTYDGSCNWMKVNEIDIGQVGTQRARDYGQTSYADGISEPRQGPNARAVSNAFFKRKDTIYYEHTPLLLGLIEVCCYKVT
jgi:peroxidase